MSAERDWLEAREGFIPEDVKIVWASVDYWDRNLAEQFGFPELVPDVDGVSFYVAVGMNSEGQVVGAKLLSDKPINHGSEHWVKERYELFLENRARKIFGLVPPENMV